MSSSNSTPKNTEQVRVCAAYCNFLIGLCPENPGEMKGSFDRANAGGHDLRDSGGKSYDQIIHSVHIEAERDAIEYCASQHNIRMSVKVEEINSIGTVTVTVTNKGKVS